ncbi:MAG: sulfotransferase domain-containing protein [Chlamydiota bacterium]
MLKINRLFIYISFLLSSTFSMGESTQPCALITIPKSGSHMVIKALYFLTGGAPIWHTHFPSKYYIAPEEGFLYTHFCVSSQLEENYAHLPRLKKIVNVRDLRDVCVSIVHQVCKSPWPGMSQKLRNSFKEMTFEEQLLFVINFDYELEDVAEFAPNSLQISIAKVAEQAMRYVEEQDCLVCKYENLVGPRGGGTEDLQKEELRRIVAHLGFSAPESLLEDVASRLYGNEVDPFGEGSFANFRSTFHQGKVNNWKNFFTEEHKEAFKQRLGKSLIALGYEKDENW